jgi:phospholipid/cholesterol/gamma-HCH transport system ATP-binding protein
VWSDVSLTLPTGEISVLLGPSGTGKSVFLKALVGLLKPDRGHIWIGDRDLPRLSEKGLYEIRRLFGVLLFALNFVITVLYFQIVPQKGQ